MSKSKEKDIYTAIADSNNNWAIKDLPEGEYDVEVYIDKNENGKYDSGNAYPYTESEEYFKYSNIIKIISRWKVDNFNIKINN